MSASATQGGHNEGKHLLDNGCNATSSFATYRLFQKIAFAEPTKSVIAIASQNWLPICHRNIPQHRWTPSNTWFLRLIRTHNPNGISIGSGVFAQTTTECL